MPAQPGVPAKPFEFPAWRFNGCVTVKCRRASRMILQYFYLSSFEIWTQRPDFASIHLFLKFHFPTTIQNPPLPVWWTYSSVASFLAFSLPFLIRFFIFKFEQKWKSLSVCSVWKLSCKKVTHVVEWQPILVCCFKLGQLEFGKLATNYTIIWPFAYMVKTSVNFTFHSLLSCHYNLSNQILCSHNYRHDWLHNFESQFRYYYITLMWLHPCIREACIKITYSMRLVYLIVFLVTYQNE